MALILFLVLTGLPILEIMVFIQAGGSIGWINVVLLTILTALTGTAIIRWQGFQALMQARAAMADGEAPVAPVVDGVFLLVAAPLMMTPGFITDGIGFALLVPPIRREIARWALRKFRRAQERGTVTIIRR